VVGDAFFGISVIADNNLIAGPYYHAVGYPWGPGLAASQVIGGGAIWILGDLVGLPFLAVALIQMMREDQAEAVAIDAELDAREAARPQQATRQPSAAEVAEPAVDAEPAGRADSASGVTAEADVASDAMPPWWESDPRFTGRFKDA
jgi:hypothetical protein